MMKKLFILTLLFCGLSVSAQTNKKINYGIYEFPKSNLGILGKSQIQATAFKVFQIDIQTLKNELEGIANRDNTQVGFTAQLEFPYPDGSMHSFEALGNSTIHPLLGDKFPEIKTYDAINDEDGAFVKWDITSKGFHAMIMIPGESTIFIDPYISGNTEYYIVYRKKDFTTNKVMGCSFDSDLSNMQNKSIPTTGSTAMFGTCELRTYRLALSATGEYSAFHGGTVAAALAAQVTTMNRVNGVFEKDMAITMTIIANNNLIIYTNTATDPFTNGTPGSMINENQSNTDAVIGNGNYDIGHVFGTNSGGLAGLGVVCNNSQKARGVTGSGAPIGDSFDIDYVAHEMGHQFGANHTQNNNCNRNNATAMEPGSASTIMGYAGICPPNVQNNSDDHFHGVSLGEISNEILSAGHTCEALTSLSNNPPVIMGTNGNVNVPANTPFALTATVVDPEGDPLTYNWEQMDNAVSTQPPVGTSTDGPNFRSISSLISPTRYFPNLADLSAGISPTWEVLSSVTRTMNFRITVRDNAPGPGGCNDFGDLTVTVDGNSGPFIVLYPSVTGIVWAGASSETVTWDVANTDNAPVSCSTVDILLSEDGGLTYPYTLATGVANDGSEVITVPNIATTTARVMVINSGGTFFDISDNDFEITMATFDYTLGSSTPSISVCQPADALYTIDIGSIGGYNDPVTLSVTGVPAGAASAFGTNPVTPAGTSVLTISNTGAAAPGTYTLTVQGVSTTGTKTTNVTLNISSGAPSSIGLITPANLATGVNVPTAFTWNASVEPGVAYDIEIASDAGFATIIDQGFGLTTPDYNSAVLAASTTYYWRVKVVSGCGNSVWSTVWSFTTSSCSTTASIDVGQTTDVASFTSTIIIAGAGTITDVNVAQLDISHPWVGDLSATLTSPTGTVVQLFDGPGIPASTYGCAGDDIDVQFDDVAALTSIDFENACGGAAPTISGPYQSMDPMSNFNGESITGTWTLTVFDSYTAGDDGILNAWSLELCTTPAVPCNAPGLPTLAGTNTICESQTTTLSVTGGNLNDATDWQWYSGSCGGTLEGTGTSLAVSPLITTTYFVRGEGGCVIPGTCAQFVVTVNPIYNETESAVICDGDTYTFPDGSTGTTAQVYTSLLTSVVTGCDSLVMTTLNVTPIESTSESAEICSGDTYIFPDGTTGTSAQTYTSTLTSVLTGCDSLVVTTLSIVTAFNSAENATICNGETYTFPDGSTGTSAQVYTSTLLSTGGCDSIVVTTLTVNMVDVSVTENAPMLTANAVGAGYVWIDCDDNDSPIAGETNVSYTPTATIGNYAVIVTENGCSDTSICYLIDYTGISEVNGESVLIFPNPTSSSITLEWSGEISLVELTDSKGRLLHEITVNGQKTLELNLNEYSAGVYFVNVFTNEGRQVFDILKQ